MNLDFWVLNPLLTLKTVFIGEMLKGTLLCAMIVKMIKKSDDARDVILL